MSVDASPGPDGIEGGAGTSASARGAHLRVAAGLLCLSASLAAWGGALTLRWRVGETSVAIWDGLVFLGVALALAGAWRRRVWGYEWAMPGNLLGGVTATVQSVQGTSWMTVVAVLHGLAFLLVATSREAFVRPAAGEDPGERPATFDQWLRDNLEAIVVAFVLALVIRCFFLEVFKIPTGSMQPTLWGDVAESRGDRIMVDKLIYRLKPVERFDVIVFRFPLNLARNFIKRAIGLPGEEILLHDGDVYVRKDGEPEFRTARKPFQVQESVWIAGVKTDLAKGRSGVEEDWDAPAAAAWECGNGRLTVDAPPGAASPDYFKLRERIRDGYTGSSDNRWDGDIRLRTSAAVSPGGRIGIHLFLDTDDFWIEAGETGGTCRWEHPGRESRTLPLPEICRLTGSAARVEAMMYDGLLALVINGASVFELDFRPTYKDLDLTATLRRGVEFGSAAEECSFTEIAVDHDLYLLTGTRHSSSDSVLLEDRPFRVPPGKYFAMGDNSPSSHDSRLWRLKTIGYLDENDVLQTVSGDSSRNFEYLDEVVLNDGRRLVGSLKLLGDDRFEITRDPVTHIVPKSQVRSHDYRAVLCMVDRGGIERLIPKARIVEEPAPEHAPFISEEEMVGRAFFVWLPLQRVKLIR